MPMPKNNSKKPGQHFQRLKLASAITASVLMTFAGQSVYAEDTEAGANAIEEVTVTARRRAENLQEVPVSVTSFSSSDIQEVGITDVTHISELTPNLIIQPNTGGSDGSVACMRGLCRTDFPITEDPMVGVYLDGVYISKSIGSLFDMAELERVEILRGPQGTLYGKNTMGGAILLHTRKPSGEFGGNVSATVGNFNRTDAKGYLEFPIVKDKLAANVSILSKTRDPFIENTQGGDRWDEDNLAARTAFRWFAAETVTVDYAFDWQKKRETPPSPAIVSASGVIPGAPGVGFGERYADDVQPKYQETVSTYGASYSDVDVEGHNLTVAWDINDNLTLKSISGYREVENDLLNNSVGASDKLIYTHDTATLDATSQEFQLSGVALNENLQYIVGLFYFAEDGEFLNNQEIEPFGAHNDSFTSIDNTSMALFGEVTYSFTEKLEASLGLRFTDEEREGQHTVTDVASGFTYLDTINQTYSGAPANYDTKISTTNTSPRLSVKYQFTDDLMAFATYANGFRSGGFNARSFTPLQWGPYDDAQTNSFEVGMKSNWMEDRVLFNATVFYQDITDIQAQVNAVDPDGQGGYAVVIENAAEATVYGLEAELILRLVRGLDISGGFGYTDASYDEYISADPVTGLPSDVADDRAIEYTPETNYSISLNYQFPSFTDVGSLTARLDWSGQSKVRFTPIIPGNDDIAQGSYNVFNARIAFDEIEAGDGSLGFALWGRNLADEHYKIGGYEFNAGPVEFGGLGRVGISQWGEPRTYGLDVFYRFGALN